MPPRLRSQSGYLGVRERPNGTFTAEIRSGDSRVPLRTFRTATEAARAYDAAAWRLNRPRRSMNFQDCRDAQEAASLAPEPRLVTAEDRRAHRFRATLRLVEERDQRAVDDWYRNHPEEELAELEFWNTRAGERAERRAEHHEEREERRRAKEQAEADLAAGLANWPAGDPRWLALQEEISETTNSDSDFSSDSDFEF